MTVGERIKNRRKELGISADVIASALGVDRTTVFRYEKGAINKVPSDALSVIASLLHTSPAYLMGWTDEPAFGCTLLLPLSDREKALVCSYRSLPSAGKDYVDETVELAKLKYKSVHENSVSVAG